MPSYHHSEVRKDRGKGGNVERICGETKKRNYKKTDTETRNTDPNPKDRKLSNRAQKHRYRREKSSKMYRKDCYDHSSPRNDSSSSSPMRSPWATPQKVQNTSAWSRSPKRPDGFYRKSSDNPSETESRENFGSDDSNSCSNHYEEEYESTYVYEKIDGWDTDTDDEETTKSE